MKDFLNAFYVTFIFENRWRFFYQGFLMTILLTLTSFLFGSLLGALFCKIKMSEHRLIRRIVSCLVSFFIQIPTLVLLMFLVYIIFKSVPLSVVVIVIFGLTLKAASYLSEIFYTAINSVNKGEVEAAETLGLSRIQTFFYVILPQSVDMALPVYKNQFIITLQETSIVGYLAIIDLTRASDIVTARTLNAMFGLVAISILYLILGWVGNGILTLISRRKHLEGDEIK